MTETEDLLCLTVPFMMIVKTIIVSPLIVQGTAHVSSTLLTFSSLDSLQIVVKFNVHVLTST